MQEGADVSLWLPSKRQWRSHCWQGPRRGCFRAFRTYNEDAGISVQHGDRTVALLGFDAEMLGDLLKCVADALAILNLPCPVDYNWDPGRDD